MLPNIVLIGFMGCGKSSVGRRLSTVTGHRFVDTDELIVHEQGVSISEIFSTVGESGFRDIEEATLRELVGVCGIILSTGGGIVLREANRPILRSMGIVVWLDASPETLFERASRTGKRPLLHVDDPRTRFEGLLENRRAIYEEVADFRVDSTTLDHDEVTAIVLEGCRRHGKRFVC
ncbi:MAG: shikimate kinase [Terrimicrobiaceae bacterium]